MMYFIFSLKTHRAYQDLPSFLQIENMKVMILVIIKTFFLKKAQK